MEKGMSEVPGFPCPICNRIIRLSLIDLLQKKEVTCSQCMSTFKMDNPAPEDDVRRQSFLRLASGPTTWHR
jgi:transcription elongation factor Elf1